MPADNDEDVHSTPHALDPQGLLTPAERVTVLFAAMREHVNNDLTRKHGAECEVCSGAKKMFELPAAPPARAPRSAAVSRESGRRAAATQRTMRNRRATTAEVRVSEAPGMQGCVRCRVCGFGRTRRATHTITATNPVYTGPYYVVGAELCDECTRRLDSEGNRRTGWRFAPIVPGGLSEPDICDRTTCANPAEYVITATRPNNLGHAVGTRLCRPCSSLIRTSSYQRVGWRTALINGSSTD